MFASVLIANRGEIALRVIRTCRGLGIRTIAVFSDADARSPHVAAADEAHRIGPGPATESYLRADVILDTARRAGAEAIHPGYGFLAENADVAEACEAEGVTWIGPPPAAMRALGDKARAKALAEANHVPVLPGYHGDMLPGEEFAAVAETIGYPLLVKASAGGGGRGMRLVETPDAFPEALAAARREALAAFGDDRVLLERSVGRPRHVEIQIAGDRHGALVHLGERECSIQRRHQKLIEESPSPAVSPSLRAEMGEAALRLARAAGYQNLGTVEFLLDPEGRFWFLEVNARLQVEHPVTEAVTGLDLVELQLRLAAGEPLGLRQEDVRLEGHAVELRLVAEDPRAGFLPATGVIRSFVVPARVRVDAGVEAGTPVPPYYDSLLAKVIAHEPHRPAVIARLRDALDELWVDGVETDADLLAAILDEPAFRAGDLDTAFLETHGVVERIDDVPPQAMAAAGAARCLGPGLAGSPGAGDPWRAASSWRIGRVRQPSRWRVAARELTVVVTEERPDSADGFRGRAEVNGEAFDVALPEATGEIREVRVTPAGADAGGSAFVRLAAGARRHGWVEWAGRRHRLDEAPALSVEALVHHAGGEAGSVVAPMPGRIVRVLAADGDHVTMNAPLLVLEAMKMEHVIAAPGDGRIAQVLVGLGDQVAAGAVLAELEPSPPEAPEEPRAPSIAPAEEAR